MTQNIQLDHEDILHQGFTDPIQEMLSGATINLRLEKKSTTSVKIVAGTGSDQAAISVSGRYRFRTTEASASLPGGLPDGIHPVFVTASDNDYTGPPSNIDEKTVYTFGLEIKEIGKTPATALYRQIGAVAVVGGVIAALEQLAGRINGPMLESGALSNNGDITWGREASGAWVPQIKENAIGAAEIAPSAVAESELADAAVTSRKSKLTSGVIGPTGSLALTNAYQDASGGAGGSLEITPAVPSVLLVDAFFYFLLQPEGSGWGTINVDGTDLGSTFEELGSVQIPARGENPSTTRAMSITVPSFYRVPLTAAKHTIKLRAKKVTGGASTNLEAAMARYVLIAS